MRSTYYADVDMLRIVLGKVPYKQAASEEPREGFVLLFDESGRLAEIEIENASQSVDLSEMRRMLSFEEVAHEHP